ncbi:MAG TPA: hypothetical protein PLH27_01945 [bacterium]|nr:hypothetical protein [bacterium]HMW34951.1 hypothetical protein [bacterium]HMY35600.1 hypothetical protein [bacterium]HMZ03000.1 hypothetical protein [bacterium]HNB08079.1 hypothetical protein [bacterium]
MRRTVFFIVSIDTECDKSIDWSITYPFSFRNIHEGVAEKLQPLFDIYKVKPTYLLSPEVIYNQESVNYFKSIQDRCELGTHLHGELIGYDKLENPRWTNDFQCDYDEGIEREKLESLTELFKNKFGYMPKSFRAGRFGIGPNTWRILAELGYAVDSSLLPFQLIKTKNATYNFYYTPVKPFYPDLQNWMNFEKQEIRKILHVPMTVHNWFFQRIPPCIGKPLSEQNRIRSLFRILLTKEKEKTYSLRPRTDNAESLINLIKHHIKIHTTKEPIVLNMMFHSNELHPGASPYAQSPLEVGQTINTIKRILDYINRYYSIHSIGLCDSTRYYERDT